MKKSSIGQHPRKGSVLIWILVFSTVFLVGFSDYPRSRQFLFPFTEIRANVQVGNKWGLIQRVITRSGAIDNAANVDIIPDAQENLYRGRVWRSTDAFPSVIVDTIDRWSSWDNFHGSVGKVLLARRRVSTSLRPAALRILYQRSGRDHLPVGL